MKLDNLSPSKISELDHRLFDVTDKFAKRFEPLLVSTNEALLKVATEDEVRSEILAVVRDVSGNLAVTDYFSFNDDLQMILEQLPNSIDVLDTWKFECKNEEIIAVRTKVNW